ncbi:Hypothetical protein Minf_0526 [Methylacidiphilum infernorum V4]|uniref:Uncharacterized protein n=1 Tax=Methylacidiphilum infernorum (isolate V4) TaxID=481448 RepID=B3DZG7_METI4|nr:Hypothetical protein Minf_0526 [Methylacidiphilum infernorum V4]
MFFSGKSCDVEENEKEILTEEVLGFIISLFFQKNF